MRLLPVLKIDTVRARLSITTSNIYTVIWKIEIILWNVIWDRVKLCKRRSDFAARDKGLLAAGPLVVPRNEEIYTTIRVEC